MNFNRDAQFDPIPGLNADAKRARVANDDATNLMAAQQATVDAARNKTVLLKIQPFSPATAADYIAYGQALATFEAESEKLPVLVAAQVVTRKNWAAARGAFLSKANAIDDDPGATEQV